MTFNFSDIFKSSFLENVPAFSLTDAVLALGGAFLVGMFIYLIYKKTFAGVVYSRSFNISLVVLTMLSTFVILAISSNVILSLGMVGALSIVRFRTPIKEPMDLVFLFWAIGAGIVLGAGLIPLAVLGTLLIGLILIAFVSRNAVEMPYIVMINCNNEKAEGDVRKILQNNFSRCRLKSKTVTAAKGIELMYEVRMKGGETKFVNDLATIAGVTNAALVSYSGVSMNRLKEQLRNDP